MTKVQSSHFTVSVVLDKPLKSISEIYFTGKIFNRENLISLLKLKINLSDSELIFAAYQMWGNKLFDHVDGQFSFVIWDVRNHSFFCARDPLGELPLFYWYDTSTFICSTDLQLILAHPSTTLSLNKKKLAASTVLNADVLLGCSSETYYENIYSVQAGSYLLLSKNLNISEHRYWSPDCFKSLDISDSEVPSALRELLFDSVENRLQDSNRTGALLSGGLDSSGLVSVAAKILEKQNQELTTFSSVSPFENRDIVDEREFIKCFSKSNNIKHVYITAENSGPFSNVERLVKYGHKPFYTSRHYLYSAFAEAALELNLNSILDGVYGELGPSAWNRGFYVDLFTSLRWKLLSKELLASSDVERVSLARMVKRKLYDQLKTRFLPANHSRSLSLSVEGTPLNHNFVEFFLTSNVDDLLKQSAEYLVGNGKAREQQCKHIELVQFRRNEASGYIGHNSVKFAFPYLDKNVLEFCLAAPDHLKVSNGYPRSLIRTALDGLLPHKIQWRISKEPFSPHHSVLHNQQLPLIRAQLEAIGRHDPIREVVDIDKLTEFARHPMQHRKNSKKSNFMSMHMLPRGVYLIAFLRQFPEYQAPISEI